MVVAVAIVACAVVVIVTDLCSVICLVAFDFEPSKDPFGKRTPLQGPINWCHTVWHQVLLIAHPSICGKYNIFHRPREAMLFVMVKV